MAATPVFAGWMTKLGYNSGKWQLRYFVLTPNALTYFNDTGGKVKGEVAMSSVATIHKLLAGTVLGKDACNSSLVDLKPVPENSFCVWRVLPP